MPEALFVVSAVASYLGAGFAVRLFDVAHPLLVVFLRLMSGTVVMWLWRRPWRRSWSTSEVVMVAQFGCAMACVNTAFYLAINHLPLGTAVSIEFIGPIGVGVITARSRRNLAALGCAGLGVVLLAGIERSNSRFGVAMILLAALGWAAFILVGKRVADSGLSQDGLAAGLAVSVLAVTPLAVPHVDQVSAVVLGWGVLVGVLSSVVPYALDQVILARLTTARYATLLAVMPATAALLGLVLLGQVPTIVECLGIAAVMVAVALREPPAAPDIELESAS